jgi:hypothetical protein
MNNVVLLERTCLGGIVSIGFYSNSFFNLGVVIDLESFKNNLFFEKVLLNQSVLRIN